MFGALAKKIFGSSNDRVLRRYGKITDAVNALEPEFEKLSDQDLRAKTAEFRDRIAAGEALDALLPEAFATVREAAKRTLGQRHFDVQIVGGAVLHEGNIAEMRTGEGKTIVCHLAAFLTVLSGKKAMGPEFGFVGRRHHDEVRQAAEIGDIEGAGVGWSVRTHQPGPVDGEANG